MSGVSHVIGIPDIADIADIYLTVLNRCIKPSFIEGNEIKRLNRHINTKFINMLRQTCNIKKSHFKAPYIRNLKIKKRVYLV